VRKGRSLTEDEDQWDPLWFRGNSYDAITSDGQTLCGLLLQRPDRYLEKLDGATGDSIRIGGHDSIPVANAGVNSLVIANGRAYYSVKSANRIGVINLTTVTQNRNITTLAGPSGMFALNDTHVLVCTGSQVVTLNVSNGKSAPLLTGMTAPAAVTRDAKGLLRG